MKNSFLSIIISVLCFAGLGSCNFVPDGPNSLSYTLVANFDALIDYGSMNYFNDSLLYAQVFGMDQIAYLCTKCGEEINTDFSGGWKISLKKGGLDEAAELSRFASAGKEAGLKDSYAYAAFSYNPDSSKMPDYDIEFNFSNYSVATASVIGLFINNTKAVEKLCLNDEVNQGDYMKVIAHEYLAGTEVGTEEFMLVDYTGSELKYVDTWEAWKFEKNPNVDKLKFEVVASSDKFPRGFCMDNFQCTIAVEY